MSFHHSWMTDEQLDLLLPSFLQGRPNTYTFTKALAENLLQNEAKDLPVSIFRPSIIGAAYKEPLPVSIRVCRQKQNVKGLYSKSIFNARKAFFFWINDIYIFLQGWIDCFHGSAGLFVAVSLSEKIQ